MYYKVGDKVRVRSDLEGSRYYGDLRCTDDMAEFRGQIVTIAGIHTDRYKIKEDDNVWFWSEDLFEDKSITKLTNKPKMTCKELSEKIQELEEKIEDLEYDKYDLKIKNNYLKGKVEAYEKILAKN